MKTLETNNDDVIWWIIDWWTEDQSNATMILLSLLVLGVVNGNGPYLYLHPHPRCQPCTNSIIFHSFICIFSIDIWLSTVENEWQRETHYDKYTKLDFDSMISSFWFIEHQNLDIWNNLMVIDIVWTECLPKKNSYLTISKRTKTKIW